MIVVDNTVLVDFWVGEPAYREAAHRLFLLDNEWLSPGLWQYEFGHIIAKYERLERIAASAKLAAFSASLEMVETIDSVDLSGIDEVSSRCGLKFYDASYLWLAESKGIKLYTRDKLILKNGSGVAVPMP